ncbi:MAG: class I SAM-dependent methyltransferase [Acidobacteria bacterium]|nr:class I SAM-dependent methyltransferase [Acidobacteriota bacterium]
MPDPANDQGPAAPAAGRTLAACALLSAFALLTEIALTRLLSVTLYYHYAYAVVALGLAGMGWGARGWRPLAGRAEQHRSAADACSWAATSTLLLTIALLVIPWRPFVRAVGGPAETTGLQGWLDLAGRYAAPLQLVLLILMALVPFAFAGRALATLFEGSRGRVAGLRAAEAGGAALVGLGAAAAMSGGGAPGVLILASLCAAAAGAVMTPRDAEGGEGGSGRQIWALRCSVVLLGLLAAMGSLLPFPPLQALSRFRFGLRQAAAPLLVGAIFLSLELLAARKGSPPRLRAVLQVAGLAGLLVWQGAAPLLRVQFIKAGYIQSQPLQEAWTINDRATLLPGNLYVDGPKKANFAWGSSPLHADPPVDQMQIRIDSLAASPVVRYRDRLDELTHLGNDISSFAFHMLEPAARVLVIGAGGGRDLLAALLFEAGHVTGLESNPHVVRWVCEDYRAFTGGLCDLENVNLVNAEARSWLSRSQERFDLIQMAFPDTWAAGAAGPYALTENFLFTREAFATYLQHLGERGMLSISIYHQSPEAPATERLFLTAVEALEAAGASDPGAHLFLVSNLGSVQPVATLVVSRAPFEAEQIGELYRTARSQALGILYPPGEEESAPYEVLALVEERSAHVATSPYDIRPVGDERPFFYLTSRSGQAGGEGQMAFHDNAVALLLPVGLVGLVAAVVGAFGIWNEEQARQTASTERRLAAFFFLTGFGFVAAEIGLSQRLALLLGGPGTALTVVLAVLMAGSGSGAALVQKLGEQRWSGWVRSSAVACAALLLGLSLLLPLLVSKGLGFPLSVRVLLVVASVAPLGFLFGVLGAAAMRLVETTAQGRLVVAWGCGALGAAAAGAAGWTVAVWFGYTAVLFLAAAAIAAAMLFAAGLYGEEKPLRG